MMEDLWIETSWGKVFAKSLGDQTSPLVLALHGWSQRNGWHTWEPMMAPLAEAGLRVVSVDMPGWGRSEPVKTGSLAGEEAVKVTEQLLDGLDERQATLMGKSWGGGIALALALNHPDRVQKLLLTAPAYRQIDALAKLRQPVLLAWAKDDPVIPYAYAEKFVEAIPDVELVTYDTGGHSAAPKNADDFAARAIQFLQA
jgi:pimeloyl-ACP methyl ester carboxylesterase